MQKWNTETIIEQFKKTHGDRYDYSLVVYEKSSSKIKIKCRKHGVFEQLAHRHIQGAGCSSCSGNKKKTAEEFIQQAISMHGDRYDYSEVIYKSNEYKIKIICSKHGPFMQAPNAHLVGKKCIKCSSEEAFSDTAEFVEKAEQKHGLAYDYSKIKYQSCGKKVEIICRKHGSFFKTPRKHLGGKGCPVCSKIKRNKSLYISGKEQFIPKLEQIHGDKYDYSLTEYTKLESKVSIICKIHGKFEKKACRLLQGVGCPSCAKNIITYKQFLENASSKHGSLYEYEQLPPDRIVFKNQKIGIKCSKHGWFEQKIQAHLNGNNCSKCYHGERTTEEFVRKAVEIHNKPQIRYDYSSVIYKNIRSKVKIFCIKCQKFFYLTPGKHIGQKVGCALCAHSISRNEEYLNHVLLREFSDLDIKRNDRKILKGKGKKGGNLEIDFVISNGKNTVYIEWNGIFWHSRGYAVDHDCIKKTTLKENLLQIIDNGNYDTNFVKQVFEEKIRPFLEKHLTNKNRR